MKTAAVSIVLIGALGAGFLAGAWYNQRESVSAASLRARRILYYVDPMHPAYKSEKPGRAPDCGMELEPVYADGGAAPHAALPAARAASELYVTTEQQQQTGIRVAPVEAAPGTGTLHLFGRVAVDETRTFEVNVGIEGYVRAVSTATTGSLVSQDQWLAIISAPEARTLIQSYIVGLDVLDRARQNGETGAAIDYAAASLQQTIDRLLTIGMSSHQLEDVKQKRQIPPTLELAAPADGFIVKRHVSVGQRLMRGDELYRLADLRRVWVLAEAFGADAEVATSATGATVSIPGRARSLAARVSREVPPQFNADSQSVTLRLDVDNPSYLLRPDMFVDVHLPVALGSSMAVPTDAIIDTGVERTVFVERRTGVFEPRRVETGWRIGGRVEIVKGLAAGERIAVAGAFVLAAERQMQAGSPDAESPP